MSKNKKKKKKIVKPQAQKPQEQKEPFVCLRCGHCCIYSTPSFTKEEYKVVRDLKVTRERNVRFEKVKFETLVNRFNPKQVYQAYSYFTMNSVKKLSMLKGETPPPCEFLDKDEEGKHSCAIYSHRPSVCRDFGVKEWTCPNNPDYLKKATKWGCLLAFIKNFGQ